MSKVSASSLSLPSSLSVFPTRMALTNPNNGITGEVDHLRLGQSQCPSCGCWQTLESLTVWTPQSGAVERQVIRCQGKRHRGAPKCAPQVISETPIRQN